jgi:hypothetical protein
VNLQLELEIHKPLLAFTAFYIIRSKSLFNEQIGYGIRMK